MFSGCTKLENLDLSTFNTTNVTNMAGMFGEFNETFFSLEKFNIADIDDNKFKNFGSRI